MADINPTSTGRPILENLLGPTLVTNDGEEVSVASIADSAKTIVLYFSAHWCPPCQEFTPKLSQAFAEYKKGLKNAERDVELVFVSGDQDIDSFKEYHKEMTFPAIRYESRDIEKNLSSLFKVEGIPHLEAIDVQGERIHKNDTIDLRSIITQHGAAAFPLSVERIHQLKKEEETKRTEALKALANGSIQIDIEKPGNSLENCSFSDLLREHDYVTLIYGDGDYKDSIYQRIHHVMTESCGEKKSAIAPVYIGWSLYNENCDHRALTKNFYSLLDPSQTIRDAMKSIAGTHAQAPMLGITIRNGTGQCHMNGKCEAADEPVIVSVDPMLRNLRSFGSGAIPWDEASIKKAETAVEERVAGLKACVTDFGIFRKTNRILTSSGKRVDVDDLTAMAEDGIVALYFSAHWCPPCRAFTPKLVECYETLLATGKNFEVVFISSDNTQEEFEDYFASMMTGDKKQFLALEYGERELANDLKQVFDVQGIPTLVLLTPGGTVVCKDAFGRVGKYGTEAFPWDDASVEKQNEKLLQREKNIEEAQHKSGDPVMKRMRGEPGSIIHEISDRSLSLKGNFVTVGVPDLVVRSGVLYYELVMGEGVEQCSATQFGFALDGGIEKSEHTMGVGVGDNNKSWGVCGVRQEAWHNENSAQFDCAWSAGDVIGFAANIDDGKMAVSKNGSWCKKDGCGLVFEDEAIKEGVYACFTGGPLDLSYNMKEEHFKFGLPPPEVWDSSA